MSLFKGIVDDHVPEKQNIILAGGEAGHRIDVPVASTPRCRFGEMEDSQYSYFLVSF